MSQPTTPAQYLAALPDDRRKALQAVRKVVRANLDPKVKEGIQYGMIGYFVPHSVYPAGYHCDPDQPVPFLSLASQKNHMALYIFCHYTDSEEQKRFVEEWKGAGKRLDMGKSCVRFKKLEDVPPDVLGAAVKRMKVSKFLASYEAGLAGSKTRSAKKATGKATKKKAARKTKATKTKKVAKKARTAKKKTKRATSARSTPEGIMSFKSLEIVRALALVAVVGCAGVPPTDHLAEASPKAQLFDGMGRHHREITTSSPEAQAYFDQGIAWTHSFNHDEAIRSFARAAEIDPDCAMAWWGIALCEGPNYNDPEMTPKRSASAWAALQEARSRMDGVSAQERELIEALSTRYAKPWPKDRSELEQAYADAMGELWRRYPTDTDIGTLYAEAMMVQRPWKLYSLDGEPEGDTPLIVETLERVMELDPGNPGANHLYIHAIEPSKTPEKALAAANRLCDQVPSSGHMNHMPSHIYVQTGNWAESVEQNARAMKADARYRELSPDQGIQHMYMVHNAHMLAFSAMMVGREAEAMEAARAMWKDVPPEMLEMVAPYIDLWMTSVYDVQKRFGRWDDILAEPEPPACLPLTTAVWRSHRAIAYAAKKDFEGARREHAAFREAKAAVPEDSVFGDDQSHGILDVSDHFIAGEIALQEGKWEEAVEHLEKAVAAEDELSYGEPPQWLQPTRHTLGAVYLKAGRFADAERVYRRDLEKREENGWSLYGLSRALEGQGKDAEARAVKERFAAVWKKADAPTETSCVCIPQT